jgi:hypothetical protein
MSSIFRVEEISSKQQVFCLLFAGCVLDLLFHPEIGGITFLRKSNVLLSHPRRYLLFKSKYSHHLTTTETIHTLLYNCFWALPEQSLSRRSSSEPPAIFYSLIWDSSNLDDQVPIYISPKFKEQGGPVIPPGTGFPFRRLLRLNGGGILTRLHTRRLLAL